MSTSPKLGLAISEEANALLANDPFSLLLAMVLDQQFPLERAFEGPFVLRQRIGRYTASSVAKMPIEDLVAAYCTPPALHRFPKSMAERSHALANLIVDKYSGQAQQIWATAGTGAELLARLRALPGFGEQKAKIFLALLGKQFHLDLTGWKEAAGIYSTDGLFSVADITDEASREAVRQAKRERKAKRHATRTVTLNGEKVEVPGGTQTLAELITHLRLAKPMAAEVNGDALGRSQLSSHLIEDGDVIEVVGAVAGG